MATLTEGLLGGGLRGKSGNAVYVRTKRGTVVRDRVIPRDPMTPAQVAARQRQARAARAWGELEPSEVAAWTAYARSLNLQPNNAFATLYKVLLRLDSAAPVPATPPSHPFFGDVIRVAVGSPSQNGSFLRGGQGESRGAPLSPPPAPSSKTSHLEEGVLTFTPTGPNTAGVVTELLIQPLASRNRRAYRDKYRHAAFTTFADGPQAVPVDEPGWFACAYRFVNAETGEVTAIAELDPVRVA